MSNKNNLALIGIPVEKVYRLLSDKFPWTTSRKAFNRVPCLTENYLWIGCSDLKIKSARQ